MGAFFQIVFADKPQILKSHFVVHFYAVCIVGSLTIIIKQNFVKSYFFSSFGILPHTTKQQLKSPNSVVEVPRIHWKLT